MVQKKLEYRWMQDMKAHYIQFLIEEKKPRLFSVIPEGAEIRTAWGGKAVVLKRTIVFWGLEGIWNPIFRRSSFKVVYAIAKVGR